MTIWDHGTYDVHKWEDRKVEVTFHGERLNGRYGLFPIGKPGDAKDDWMIHRMDPPADPDREPMPERIVPMMAQPASDAPARPERTGRSRSSGTGCARSPTCSPGVCASRAATSTRSPTPIRRCAALVGALGMHEAVLDGEIVAFDDDGRPSFERLQRRMHVTSPRAVRRLAEQHAGRLRDLRPAVPRRPLADGAALRASAASGSSRSSSAARRGASRPPTPARAGGCSRRPRKQGLEGVVAKRLDSRYEPGRRSGAWLKIKNTLRQELVIGGWMPGEGRRTERIGALLMGYYEDGKLRYAGRVGTGFTEKTLAELREAPGAAARATRARSTRRRSCPREAVFVEPRAGGRGRVPRVDRRAGDARAVVQGPARRQAAARGAARGHRRGRAPSRRSRRKSIRARPEALFDEVERLPEGALAVVDRRPRAEDHQLGQGAVPARPASPRAT